MIIIVRIVLTKTNLLSLIIIQVSRVQPHVLCVLFVPVDRLQVGRVAKWVLLEFLPMDALDHLRLLLATSKHRRKFLAVVT